MFIVDIFSKLWHNSKILPATGLTMLTLITEYLGLMGLSSDFSLLLASIITVFFIGLFSFIANLIANRYILKFISFIVAKTHSMWGKSFIDHHVFKHLSHVAPAAVVCIMAPMLSVSHWPMSDTIVSIIEKLSIMYIIFVVVTSMMALLTSINDIYVKKPVAKTRPIKSYLAVVKIVLCAVAIISAIIILTGESPAIFLTGLGAMTAILALTFKDTILSFVASIQLSAYDIVSPVAGNILLLCHNLLKMSTINTTLNMFFIYMYKY